MKYILDNFRTMTGGYMPGIKTDKADLRHRVIQGFVPHYMDLANEASDANLKQKINPAYPLVLSPRSAQVHSVKTGSFPTVMIANEHSSLGKVIYSNDLWNFFADDSSEQDLGIPTGTPTSNAGIDAVLFNSEVLTSHPVAVTALYRTELDASPTWSATTGDTLANGVIHILKLFQDRCLVSDSSGGSFTRRDEVKLVLPDFSIIEGIALGDTFDVMDIGTYQDRYVLLYTQKTTAPAVSPYTTVFMWSGQPGDSYDQRYILKGVYRCSIEKDGVVYAFTQIGTTLCCFAFNGGAFQEIGRIRNVLVYTGLLVPKTRIACEGDWFVILATTSGTTTASSPLYWNPFTGEAFYLIKALSSLPYKSVLIAQDPTSGTAAFMRYVSWTNGSGNGQVRKITMEDTVKNDYGSDYKSNFIPAPIDENQATHRTLGMGRIKINRIDIEYSVKSPSTDDKIDVTLTTKDEYTNETYDTYTASIENTTANSTNATVEDKRAIIDNIGRFATEFAVDLAVTVATTSWDLIIRRIIIDYTPVAHPN